LEINILRNTCLKIGTILLAVILITAALFFIDTKSALAFSPEYVTWPEYPTNPVFDPPESAYYPSIIFNGTGYQMWYDNGAVGGGISYTTSTDGISWLTGIPVTGLTRARHAVVKWVDTLSEYRVWYSDSAGIYYSINDIRTAESLNGIAWFNDSAITQFNTTVITGNAGVDWNAASYGPCDVFYNPSGSETIVAPVDAATVWQNKFVMYYDGTTGGLEDIGIAVSADGITWRGYMDGVAPVLAHSGSGWDRDFATFCTVLKIDGLYHMWYSGGVGTSHIGYAQSTDGITWTKYGSNPILHRNDGASWRLERTYTPRVLYDAASFSGHGDAVQLKMWWNGTSTLGNYAIGYSGIITATPTPSPVGVGGWVNPVDKTALLMPYFYVLLSITAIAIGGLVWRKLSFAKADSRKR
jgi:hypothetical protein